MLFFFDLDTHFISNLYFFTYVIFMTLLLIKLTIPLSLTRFDNIVSEYSGLHIFREYRNVVPTPDLLNQNMCFNGIPQ